MADKVRTRFAPSPTGYLHIGSLRAALFEYAYAKTYGGDFILRIEDTDRKRYVEGAIEGLIGNLRKFGITWDEGPEVGGPYAPYIQSERLESGIYRKTAEKLVADGHAYFCFCKSQTKEEIEGLQKEKGSVVRDVCRELTAEESKTKVESGETPAIRLRVPDEGTISYHDLVLDKDISWDLTNVDEAMLLKSDGFPTYHLGVVVDDVEMAITNILRGFEWLPSTPIHLLLYKYLGYDAPKIGHFSLILDPSGGKLSKRKGNVSVEDFLKAGYLPEAILNFVMLLGWAPKDNRELFTLPEYVNEFKNGSLQTSNAVFNKDKLDWFNGYYIRALTDAELTQKIYEFYEKKYAKAMVDKSIPLIKDRIVKLSDYATIAGFFYEKKSIPDELKQKINPHHLKEATIAIETLDAWELDKLNDSLVKVVDVNGFKTGEFFMSIRIAVCASAQTPPINESMIILGKNEVSERLKAI